MPTLSDAIQPCWRAWPLGMTLTSLSAPAACGETSGLDFLLGCRYGQAPCGYFFIPRMLRTLCHMALSGLAASCGVGTHRLQRPSIRAGSNTRTLRSYPGLQEAPQGKKELTSHRHHPDTPHTLATATKALRKPATQRPRRLITAPTPGPRPGHPAHVPVPRLGDTLFPRTRTALIRRWCYARQTSYLATLLQRAPANKFHPQPP
jgi:hypothetical protein